MVILTLNCGSSSVKYQVYDWDKKDVLANGIVERVTIGGSFITHKVRGRPDYEVEHECPNHVVAIELILKTLTDPEVGVIPDLSTAWSTAARNLRNPLLSMKNSSRHSGL